MQQAGKLLCLSWLSLCPRRGLAEGIKEYFERFSSSVLISIHKDINKALMWAGMRLKGDVKKRIFITDSSFTRGQMMIEHPSTDEIMTLKTFHERLKKRDPLVIHVHYDPSNKAKEDKDSYDYLITGNINKFIFSGEMRGLLE
ncbi:hypothetical protein J4403_00865 [Candidatus Woesearchaeota archaeon]|nr:hypothetical protein [Candidatus Woesearchaeota archaeon]